mgnify:CR=1 FL=1
MRTLLLLMLTFFSFHTLCFASLEDIKQSFSNYTAPKIAMIENSYKNIEPRIVLVESGKKTYYVKALDSCIIKHKVLHNNSRLNPVYTGIVTIHQITRFYHQHDSRKKAIEESRFELSFTESSKLYYKYVDSKWLFYKSFVKLGHSAPTVQNHKLGTNDLAEYKSRMYYMDNMTV